MSELADQLKASERSLPPFAASDAKGLIDASLDLGDFDAALAAVERAKDRFETRQDYLRKKLTVLKRAQRHIEALDVAKDLHELEPNDKSVLVQMGRLNLETGRLVAAKSTFMQILSQDPRSVPGWLGRIEVARKEGDLMAAAKLAEKALSERPNHPAIANKTASAFAAVGRLEEAEEIIDRTIRQTNEERPDMLLARALILRKLGNFTASEEIYRDILLRDPGNRAAWASHVKAALAQGNVDEALQSCSDALELFPGSPGLLKLQADVLRRVGRKSESVAALDDLHRQHPKDIRIAVAFANVLRGLGRFDEADALYVIILEQEPENWPALQGRVTIAGQHGDFETAMQMLEQSTPEKSSQSHSQARVSVRQLSQSLVPEKLLCLAEFAVKAGDDARLHLALEQLGNMPARLNDAQIVRLIGIAGRAQRLNLVAKTIQHTFERDSLTQKLAVEILQLAHNAGEESIADAVEDRLAAMLPVQLSNVFRIEATRMRRGPTSTLDVIRRNRLSERTPAQASELSMALLLAGKNKLALRYLKLCHRKWPHAPTIRRSLLEAFLGNGLPEDARDFLAGLEECIGPEAIEGLRLKFAIYTGQTRGALDLLEKQIREGRRKRGDYPSLRLYLALGYLEDAEKAATALKTEPNQTSKQAFHFGVMHIGAVLNELRLYKRFNRQRASAETHVVDVQTQYFVAKDVLDTWEGGPWQRGETAASTVPMNIFQYWNTEDVPEAVTSVMSSWQAHPGWQYERLNRRSAIKWLHGRLGANYARAFKLANNVAEESDFLRLCLLLAEGGIYVDADDRLIDHPADLLSFGSGIILFREPNLGAIANNLLCAPKGHPVIARAAEMALRALLRRDNESTWSKTGPGLLTRATALHVINEPKQARESLALVPRIFINRYTQRGVPLPYKSTPKYWNARNASVAPAIKDVFADISKPSQPSSA